MYCNCDKSNDGDVDRCCFFFPVKCGTYALGLVLCMLVIEFISLAVFNYQAKKFAVIGLVYVSLPLITFLIMCLHNSISNVAHFALAYKCFAFLNSIVLSFLMIYAILSAT